MKWIRSFILSAGAILLVAALTRFFIAFSNAQVLSLPEPMIGIPLRDAVLLVGLMELAVALLCLFGKRIGLQVGCVAWLAVTYAVYRIGAIAMGGHHQATAIGSLTNPLQLSRGFAGMMVGLAPVCLLMGGSASTVWLLLRGRSTSRRKEQEKFIKMSCPACGVHIRFERERLGQQLDCPQCRKSITLHVPKNLKMSCFFCHEHIEFPAHAIGEKMPCPHCKKDITLQAQ
jgi:predicted RNA-binding Zn-ribbon protein involved in translation (DUF1610 family)